MRNTDPLSLMTALRASDGLLFTESGLLVICAHPDGERVAVPWPLLNERAHATLAAALFDLRETGDLPRSTRCVRLPSGSLFNIDSATITPAC